MGNWFNRDNEIDTHDFVINTYDIDIDSDIPKGGDYDDINTIKCQYAFYNNTGDSKEISLDVYYKYTDTNFDKRSRENSIKAFKKQMDNIRTKHPKINLNVNILTESEDIPSDYGIVINSVDMEVVTKIKYGTGREKSVYDVYFKGKEIKTEMNSCERFKEVIISDLRNKLNKSRSI